MHLEGSKPKRFVTKTVLTNPSLCSVSMTSLMDPQNYALPQIYQALHQKQKLVAEREQNIKKQYSPEKKLKVTDWKANPEYLLPIQKSFHEYSVDPPKQHQSQYFRPSPDSLQMAEKQFDKGKKQPSSRGSNKIAREQSEQTLTKRNSSMPSLLGLHYTRTTEIKEKQSKPFNIISNL